MTLPNKITLSRILLAPGVYLLFQFFVFHERALSIVLPLIWGIFILSELSDLLDGFIARRTGQVSDVGKLLDPFADVICRVTYFVSFTVLEIMPVWALMIILYRELTVLFLRMWLLKTGGVAMGARWGGKLKSLLYFFASLLGLALLTLQSFFPDWPHMNSIRIAVLIVFSASAAAALLSWADYFRVVLKSVKEKTN